MATVKVGQIWREVDPRFVEGRFVKVLAVYEDRAKIRRVTVPSYAPVRGSRESEALLSRFNGKRGGYEFVEEPADV